MNHQSSQNDATELILSQWQTCVEMADSISQRRDSMNNLFVTLNLALTAAVSVIWDIKSIILLGSGIGVCILWLFFINNFKQLNVEKYKVINNLEKDLPAKPFNDEWQHLEENEQYMTGTSLEFVLPAMFIILYAVLILVIII